jgi:threonine dehydrogenase-like Zn-dependent dehydrogenase
MGIVEEVGPGVTAVAPGDRVVIPFNVSCGTCAMCGQGLQSQCETTQVREQGSGASLFGYTKLYGSVPGGQAEYLRVPFGNTLPIKVPEGPADDRFVYLSDVLPTSWQAVAYADVPRGGSLAVLGLGPIVDLVPERLERARANGVEVVDLREHGDDLTEAVQDKTDGRGPHAVIDAVGMEAHGSPGAKLAHQLVGLLPDALAEPLMQKGGVDRLNALYSAIDLVRRGGTISLSGVYGGMADPMPMLTMFDKQIQLRMGQANVWRWVDDILPLLVDGDPLGVDGFATHRLPLEQAPEAYDMFQDKRDGAVKVVFKPGG